MMLYPTVCKRIKLALIISTLLITQSCTLDIPLENAQTDPYVIYNLLTAQELLASAYQEIPKSQFELELLSDNFTPSYTAINSPSTYHLFTWQSSAITNLSNSLWPAYYKSIAFTNAVIERIKEIEENSDEQDDLRKVWAEALTLKSYSYFQLLQLYATPYTHENADGIILKNKTEAEIKMRSTKQECASEIINLLNEALALDESFPTQKNRKSKKIYTNSLYAQALLAKVYLYIGNYEMAEKKARICIDKWNNYPPTASDYQVLWSESESQLSLFTLANSEPFYKDLIDISNPEVNNYYIEKKKELKEGDIRKDHTTHKTIISSGVVGETKDVLELQKYNKINKEGNTVAHISIMRHPEPLFILCEALYFQNKLEESLQLLNNYLNAVKADTYALDNIYAELLLNIIIEEKSKEFIGEGLSFFDMKRHGLKNSDRIEATDYRWTFPIPASEYKTNTYILNQNEGWPKIIR